MRLVHAIRMATAFGVAALLLAGCGPGKPSAPTGGGPNAGNQPQPPEVWDLKMIGLAYHSYMDANKGKGPAKVDDLYPYLNGAGSPQSQGLASGKYKVYLNANWDQLIKAMSSTVIGYYEVVPTAGGPVLMGDASVHNMTAGEFKNAPKAGQ